MFGSNILEIAAGIIFVFILVSTICTAIREGIESFLKTRAAYLEHGIRELLKDPQGNGLAKSLYEHPLIYGLFNGEYTPGTKTGSPAVMAGGSNLPSYIPSKNFALALMDIAARGPVTDDNNTTSGAPVVSLDAIRANIGQIGNPYIQRLVLNAIDTAQGDLNKAQLNIENWYNSTMDRVSGWYKRSTQTIIFVVALAVSVGLNINSITILNYLSKNDTARKMVISQSTSAARDTIYKQAKTDLDALKLPVGWNYGWQSIGLDPKQSTTKYFDLWNWIFGPLLGLLITTFAATLGAPFWFDMLNKVMVIRSTVKPHQKSGEESSDDGQSKPPTVLYAAVKETGSAGTGGTETGTTGTGTVGTTGAGGAGIETAGTGTSGTGGTATGATGGDEIDGCDVVATQLTADNELPESKGGIA